MRFLSTLTLFLLLLTGVSAQTRLVGSGTTVSNLGTLNFDIEIVFSPKPPGAELASLGVRRIGTIRMWNGAKVTLTQTIYITQPGDTSSYSLIGFYVDKGYPATLTIETWSETKPFIIRDTFLPDWKTTGSFPKVNF